jgi:hypothetical protein
MAAKTAPSTATCAVVDRAGSRNGGRKARKNTTVFGLSSPTATPSARQRRTPRPASRGATGPWVATAPDRRRWRIAVTPSSTRYAAPANLITVNAVADSSTSRPSPTATASAWT